MKIFLAWPENLIVTNKNFDIMKKLAMVLALAFTMGLAASTVSASTKDDSKKTDKKECCAKADDKKACCSKDAKACCSKDAKTCTEKKADAPVK